MALEAVGLTNDNCESIRVNVVVSPNGATRSSNILHPHPMGHILEHTNGDTDREAMCDEQTNWEPVRHTAYEGKGTFENQHNWDTMGDIMENEIEDPKRDTRYETKHNWEPVGDVMESAIEEANRDTFESERNWESVRDIIECANDDVDRDRLFESDRNWAPENDVVECANHELRQIKFENKSKWQPVEDGKKLSTYETQSKYDNWESVDNESEHANDEASRETMFESHSHWEPVEDIIEHDVTKAKQETFQVLPKQCIKENPNWEDAKSIGDVYLNQQIKGDFVLTPEFLQSSNLYFTIQGQTPQLNEYQDVSDKRYIEINRGTPGKVVQIPLSLLQEGFDGQLPFEIPVPPLIPITKKNSKPKQNECPKNESMPDFSDSSIELPPLVPIRKKYRKEDEKSYDKMHTETSVFKKPEASMKKHKMRVKKFPCLICDFVADHSYQLKIHISLTHDRNNQFKCNFCDYRSKYKKALYQHQKTHTEYRCGVCDYKCGKKSNLKIHQKTHKSRSVISETLVHGAFQLCSNSTIVSQQQSLGTPYTYTNNQ